MQQQHHGMMQQQQPGILYPQTAPTMQHQFMSNQPPVMTNQLGGSQQQPIVVQAQAIQQTGGQQAL